MPLVQVPGRPCDALVDHRDGRRGRSCLWADPFRFPGRGASTTGVAPSRGLSNSRGTPGSALPVRRNNRCGRFYLRSPPRRVLGRP
jgi:hypothetical protein